MPDAPLQPRSNFAARFAGFLFALGGGAAIYWQGFLPLKKAQDGLPLIEYSIKLIVLGIFFVLMGLYWLIFGLPGYEAVRSLKDRPRAMKILAVVSFIVAIASWWGINQLFAAYGYSER